jgi:4-hydroxybenzoyl-CoA reductase alpha subunit
MAYSIIGKPFVGPDAPLKASGRAQFVADLALPGMLFGRLLHSPHPHARIMGVDTSRAKALPGVVAVLTGRDLSVAKYGLAPNVVADRYPLAIDRVRFVGEEVAAVAAQDEDTAEEALTLIDVAYELLPAVFEAEEALKADAPRVGDGEDNLCGRVAYSTGNVDEGLALADYVREDTFTVEAVTHAAIEPHGALAAFDPLGNLTVWTSSQTATWVRSVLARTLGITEERVRVVAPYVGGAFGGKSGLFAHEIVAALLARATGRPVKLICSREEVFTAGTRRHAMTIHLKTGVRKDGTLLATRCRVFADSGAYANMGPASISYTAAFLTLPYLIPNVDFEAFRVYTNRSVCGPQRGPGTPPIRFAVEGQLDRLARDLGLNPLEIRRRNALGPNMVTPSHLEVTSCGLERCLETVEQRASTTWGEGEHLDTGLGWGLACSGFMSGYNLPPYIPCPAVLKVEGDGTVSAFTIASDFGQGADAGVQQIVAEELGLPLEAVRVRSGDTALVPDAWWSFADTFAIGNAVRTAAIQMREALFQVVADRLEASPTDLIAAQGRVFVGGSPERGMTFAEAAHLYLRRTKRPATSQAQYCANTDMLHVGQRNVSRSYSFAAQAAGVRVDRETGQVDLLRLVSAYDCGFAINPLVVQGLLEGAVAMGQGQALQEGLAWQEGQALNPSFLDYRFPTALDCPQVEPVLVESLDPEGPYGAKEVGQGSLQAVAPAIANAIFSATGVEVSHLPVTPERLLEALQASRSERGA